MEKENLMIDNLEELKNEVKMSGFNNYFDNHIDDRIRAGQKEFLLEKVMEINDDILNYTLHFRVDEERRKGYFNDMDTVLKDAATGEERKQTFPRYLRITAKEAFNLLKFGDDTAVQKRLFSKNGDRYLSYITLDLKSEKDEHNNYPLKQYHENYYKEQPFVLKDALKKLPVPVKELENATNTEFIIASLKRGNSHQVTIFHEGKVEKGYLMVNAKAGRVEVKDSNMKAVKGENKEQKINPDLKQEVAPGKQDIIPEKQDIIPRKQDMYPEKQAQVKKKTGQEIKTGSRFPETKKKGPNQHRSL